MALLFSSIKLCLLSLSLVGLYTSWYLIFNNGTYSLMTHIVDEGPRILPGTDAPLKTSYTGVRMLDYHLTMFTLFLWELIDGSNPNASLLFFHFVGQIAAGWGLLMVEASRTGNRGSMVSLSVLPPRSRQGYAHIA